MHIDSFAHGGLGVAREQGRVVFVADAIPGETVVAELIDEKKRFARAVAVDVIEASADRVPHIWPEASIDRAPEQRPGGADLGFMTRERQGVLKRDVVLDALARFAGGAHGFEQLVVEPVEPSLAWRSRISLQVNADGVPGPLAARSHRVVPVSTYPLATEEIAAAAPWRERVPGAERIDVVSSSSGELRIRVRQPGEAVDHTTLVHERVNGRSFAVAEGGFWQVHLRAAETLQAAVRDALAPERLQQDAVQLDLYGGVGVLAVPLLEAVGPTAKLLSIESSARATQLARQNLAEWPGSRAETARVERIIERIEVTPGASVVLDPPRAGAGRAVVQFLAASPAAQIIYVACDPVAFARDLGTFRAAGWEAETLRAIDLFPNTHHLELVARIVKR